MKQNFEFPDKCADKATCKGDPYWQEFCGCYHDWQKDREDTMQVVCEAADWFAQCTELVNTHTKYRQILHASGWVESLKSQEAAYDKLKAALKKWRELTGVERNMDHGEE